jgi:CheY-like chemotaxis protein
VSILFERIVASFPPQSAFSFQEGCWVYSYRFPEVFEPDTVGQSRQEIEFRARGDPGDGENVSHLEIEFRISAENTLLLLERIGTLAGELGGAIKRLSYFAYKPWPEGEKPFWLRELAAKSEFMVAGKELDGESLESDDLARNIADSEGLYYSGTLEISFAASEREGMPQSEAAPGTLLGGKKVVMLVDDNDATLGLLQTILRTEFLDEELDFIPCNSGMKAFELALEKHPDMIILDLMMPEKSGFEVLEDLKKTPQTKDIPVVILSVIYDEESVNKARKMGVERYLVKPFVPYDISKVIREMLFGATRAE